MIVKEWCRTCDDYRKHEYVDTERIACKSCGTEMQYIDQQTRTRLAD